MRLCAQRALRGRQPGSTASTCPYGTDCTDCGWRIYSPPGLPPAAPPPPLDPPPSLPPAAPPPAAPPVFCTLLYGEGDCSEYNFCNQQGTCVQGLCECDATFTGVACDVKVECQYWDKATDNWSTEGCVASPPPSGRPDGFLHCNCTHLTDFGGISFPTSPEELLAELTSIKFTFFTMDDFANILGGGLDIAGNPEISITLLTVAALDILMIAYSKFRAHRRVLRRGREAAARRKELRDQARQKAREKAAADPDLLEERRRRKAAGMGKNAQAAAAKEEKEKSKRNPPIQDRVFLDLLDADMTGAEPEPSPPPRSRPETPDSLKPKLVGPDPLMAELLAPGDALPAMPAMSPGDGPAVPWAELLQQRIRSGGRGSTPTGTPPSGGVGCRMIQQRLPSKATLGSREPTPPVRSSGGPRPGRSPFNSQRIPYVNGPPAALGQAIREGTPGAAGTGSTPVRLDSLRRSPGLSPGSPASPSGGDNPGTMRQGRIPNLRGQAPGSLSSKLKESRSGGLPTTPEQGEPSVPMPVGEDGTVSTRLRCAAAAA